MAETWIELRLAGARAEEKRRREADEKARQLFLRTKQLMAAAASRALCKAGDGNLVVAVLWVEEAVEEVCLEEGLQEHVHAEKEIQVRYTGRKRVREHVLWPRTLSGRIGGLYGRRAVLWRPSNRGTRGRVVREPRSKSG